MHSSSSHDHGHAVHPLLLIALRSELSELERSEFARCLSNEAETMLASAQWHGVLPLLARRMCDHQLTAHLPEVVVAQLRLQLLAGRAQAMSQVATLLEVQRCAESEGIRVVPWKGPALAQLLYGDFTLRQSCDLDILVKPSEILKLSDALVRNGFVLRNQAATQQGSQHARHVHHEVQLTRRGHLIELHDEIMPQEYGRWLPLDDCIERAQRAGTLQKQDLWSLTPTDLLLSLCAHAAKHDWSGLKWVCDIQGLLLRFGPSLHWGTIIKSAKKHGALRPMLNGILLSAQMLDSPIPGAVVKAAAKDKSLSRMLASQSHKLKTGALQQDAPETIAYAPDMVAGVQRRFLFRLRRLFLIPSQQVDEYPLPVFILHYPLRWARLTHKGLRLFWR